PVEQRLAPFQPDEKTVIGRRLPGGDGGAHVVERLSHRHKGVFRLPHLGDREVDRFIGGLRDFIIPGV
ncbi:hypothetical protein, partial [Cronobacter dublinensis]|uniref:hypothetical protein n=1 Tax=Cronobacter dublinensis TaxID=413497 RepID=UPI0005773A4B